MLALSPTMEHALAEVAAHPGTPARELPGSVPTVEALMRRGLVEVEGREWCAFLPDPEHTHVFKTTMHLDGCHWYETIASCACGAVYGWRGERSLKADPYSAVWMDDPDGCERCKALIAGAPVRNNVVIERRR
jgi:hypothetical protein